MPEIAIFIAGFLAACFLVLLACIAHGIKHAENGVDPFAALPTFDDDEADRLLEQGA